MALIQTVANDAVGFLGLDPGKDSPREIVTAINEVIVQIVFGKPNAIPETEEKDLVLGALWGAQMVKEFGWSWADMRLGDALDVAVVSPQGDMAIYPFTFVAECIAKVRICTVALSFNMLLEKKGETIFEPGSFESVMEHIQHIVPPYTLETSG
jgi:hypothetical protein